MVAVLASSGRRPTALRPIALQWRPSLRVGECKRLLARRRQGVCLSKAKVSGRVDVYTWGLQGSVCLTTPIAGSSRCVYLGLVLGLAYGAAYGLALDETHQECDERQPRMSTSGRTRQLARTPGCTLWLSVCVRTGGRLHPRLAGERLLKQRPFSCWFRRPRGCGALREVEPGSWLGGCGCVLRMEVCCVPACPPVLPMLDVLLLAFAFLVFARLSGPFTCLLRACCPRRFFSRRPYQPRTSRLLVT